MADSKTNLKIVWNGSTKGNGSIQTHNLETKIAIAESLGGSGEGAGPKELLVSSAAACYTMTLVSILETRNLPVVELIMDSEATLTNEEGLKITHHPHMTLSADATEKQIETANRAFMSADKGCAVGNMLKKAEASIVINGKLSLQSVE